MGVAGFQEFSIFSAMALPNPLLTLNLIILPAFDSIEIWSQLILKIKHNISDIKTIIMNKILIGKKIDIKLKLKNKKCSLSKNL